MVHHSGDFKIRFEVYPMNVKGLDYSNDFTFKVLDESENRKNVIKSIEERDQKLEIKPSLFQSMVGTLMPTNQDEEEEEEDDPKLKQFEDLTKNMSSASVNEPNEEAENKKEEKEEKKEEESEEEK